MSDLENPVNKEVDSEIKRMMPLMGSTIINSKLAEQNILKQSSGDGGPSTPLDAINDLMSYCDVGIRYLARALNIKRTKLKAMLSGEASIPPEAIETMYSIFEAKKPDLFK